MRRWGLIIWLVLFSVQLMASDTIPIPLTMSVFAYMPKDGPTGSTPNPTDPNQFRASLVGNTLLVETKAGDVSYVVVKEAQSEWKDEDYFYALSYGSVSCRIKRAGSYIVHIGHWNADFIGHLLVTNMALHDFNGHFWGATLDNMNELPVGWYIISLQTNIGRTTTKFYKLQ